MKFTSTQDFTSLTELLKFYGDADEIVFKSHCSSDEADIAEACRNGRWAANRLRLRNGSKGVEDIVAGYGCRVVRETWQVADGRIVFLGECLLHHKDGGALIRVNSDATKSLAELMEQWADETTKQWFAEEKISEVVIAHELFHLLAQHSVMTNPSLAELSAHTFARAMTELPFSPLLYNVLLIRLATGKRTLTL